MSIETEVRIKEAALLVAQIVLLGGCVLACTAAVVITKVSSTLGGASEYMRACREDKEDDAMITWRDNDPSKIFMSGCQIVKGLIFGVPKNGTEDTPSQVDEVPDGSKGESDTEPQSSGAKVTDSNIE